MGRQVDVAIAGGGPFGLTLAIELGRRGVSVALYDAKASTAFNPQANATQARTMEYYRRLGFAEEIRVLGLPTDYPTDIAYFTRFQTSVTTDTVINIDAEVAFKTDQTIIFRALVSVVAEFHRQEAEGPFYAAVFSQFRDDVELF